MFTYHEDKKHEDFVNIEYIPLFFDQIESLFSDKTLEIQAKAACGDVKECLFDVAASGSLSFGNSTKQSMEHYNEKKKDINTGKMTITCSFSFMKNTTLLYEAEVDPFYRSPTHSLCLNIEISNC